MSWAAVRREFSEVARIRLFKLVAASLLLLGVALPIHALAQTQAPPAPRDDSKRVVPTRIHDRARWQRTLTPRAGGFDAGPWSVSRLQP